VRCAFLATREGGGHLSSAVIGAFPGDLERAHAAVCGPPALLDAVRQIWAGIGREDRVLAESFTPPPLATIGPSAAGTLRFLRTDRQAAIGQGEEQVDALGRELDELRNRVLADLGERDAAYIRKMIKAQRGLEITGRGLLFAGILPPA
jgi:hypothetical protein